MLIETLRYAEVSIEFKTSKISFDCRTLPVGVTTYYEISYFNFLFYRKSPLRSIFLHNIAHCVFWSQWILSTISMPSIIYKWSNAICQLFTRYTDNPKAVQSNNRRQIFKKKTISHNVKKAGRPLFSPGIIQIFFFV